MKILITGCDGLIGGEAVQYFDAKGHTVVGADNNMRKQFFGPDGDTLWNRCRICHGASSRYVPVEWDRSDITWQDQMTKLFDTYGPFDAIIHCAARPSHDKAKEIPLVDFNVNAVGTLNLLEQTRRRCPKAVFIFMSTNKVYGDAPNEMPMKELETRYDYADPKDYHGVDESMRIDRSTHSIFGVSKASADLMVQEYGRYFGMNTCVFRGGCLTGPGHSGVELHGFISYLAKVAVSGGHYRIYGYKGKQVRDNIHSNDVIRAMEQVILNPRRGEVYNMGGGRENSISVLEAISKMEVFTGEKMSWEYIDANRVGDHICYISDLTKFKSHYPEWGITKSIDDTLVDILDHATKKFWDTRSVQGWEQTRNYTIGNGVAIDVGGYLGDWAADVAERNPWGRILVFEPVKEFAQACVERFNDVGSPPKAIQATVFPFGLSDRAETLTISKQHEGSSVHFRDSGATIGDR